MPAAPAWWRSSPRPHLAPEPAHQGAVAILRIVRFLLRIADRRHDPLHQIGQALEPRRAGFLRERDHPEIRMRGTPAIQPVQIPRRITGEVGDAFRRQDKDVRLRAGFPVR